jgi:hypothetical protein
MSDLFSYYYSSDSHWSYRHTAMLGFRRMNMFVLLLLISLKVLLTGKKWSQFVDAVALGQEAICRQT